MLEKTTNLQLPLLVQNQAGKEITHNEALIILDNIVQNGVIDKDLAVPPTEPNTNDLYIVGENATGLWEDKDDQLAFYDNGWRFIEPRKGFIFWVNDESKLYCFNGTKWQEITSSSNGEITELQNLSLLGVNTTADEDNKLSIKSNYVLFDNITNNSRIKINKATINDTASHLFQTNYSGRAEFGLISNDNFTLKVSNDGENWNNAFVVDKATGNIDFKQNLTFSQTAQETIQSLGMPSNRYIDLSVTSGQNNFGIVPADGYVVLQVDSCSHYRVWNNSISPALGIWNYQGSNMNFGSGFIPIAKGQQWGIYTQDGTITIARFYYLAGSSNNN